MKTDSRTDSDDILTQFDAENWWNFMLENYPENYECASRYYTNKDDILCEEGLRPGNFDVNDYFEIYELPRITAKKGIIKVNGECVKRYEGFEEWEKKRTEFEELKKTPLFKMWKKEQYTCQEKKCAWCKKFIKLYDLRTHIDHVKPLIFDGDNSLDNLVITCADCNKNKGTKGKGFNSAMDGGKLNAVPWWIKPNKYACEDDGVNLIYDEELDLSGVPF